MDKKNGFTVVLVSETWKGKRSLKERGWHKTRAGAEQICRQWQEKTDYMHRYKVCSLRQLTILRNEIEKEQLERRKKGAQRAAKTRSQRGPANFILCPVCRAKSKKLSSMMGGLQTRRCQKGHLFEYDKWIADRSPWYRNLGGEPSTTDVFRFRNPRTTVP